MKYGVIGASGRLGSEVIKLFEEKNHKLVFAYDLEGEWKNENTDLLIDCSLPEVFNTVTNCSISWSDIIISLAV